MISDPPGRLGRSPRVRRVTFLPHTRHIYRRSSRVILDFGSLCLLVRLMPASYAIRVPQAGSLLSASFPRHLAVVAVAVRLGVPITRVPRGLSPPSHFPVRFRSPVIQRPSWALRAMPGAHNKMGRGLRPGPRYHLPLDQVYRAIPVTEPKWTFRLAQT
jgi:hypothetical protein